MQPADTTDFAQSNNRPRVHFESPEMESGVDVVEPDDYHAADPPFLTCLWLADPGVERKVKIPLTRVIRIED